MVFVKGHPGYKPKGAKAKKTLLMEERRARFDEKISQKWDKIIDKLPPTYVADQFIGKPTETIKHEGLEFLFTNDDTKEDNS